MPSHELERLGIFTAQAIAYIGLMLAVLRCLDLITDHEVKLLPALLLLPCFRRLFLDMRTVETVDFVKNPPVPPVLLYNNNITHC